MCVRGALIDDVRTRGDGPLGTKERINEQTGGYCDDDESKSEYENPKAD